MHVASYVSAVGLIGLAVYQFTQGDVQHAWLSLMGALAALGIGHGVAQLQKKVP